MMRFLCGFVMITLTLTPTTAHAHAIGAEAKLVNGQVEISAYYDDDTPAGMAKVTVSDSEGRMVVEGKTDDKGVWRFPAPRPGKYRAVVDPNDGHLAKVSFTIPDVEVKSASAIEAAKVSEGPSREEFTRTPWELTLLGLGIIGICTVLLSRNRRRNSGELEAN